MKPDPAVGVKGQADFGALVNRAPGDLADQFAHRGGIVVLGVKFLDQQLILLDPFLQLGVFWRV